MPANVTVEPLRGTQRASLATLGRKQFCLAANLAMQDGSIWPAFQPIVDLRNRDVVGYEILARWTDAVDGNVPPDQFIWRLEENDLIDLLTERLLDTAARQLIELDTGAFIGINVTPCQLLRDDLPDRIASICMKAGLPLHRMLVEITENSIMQDPARSLSTLREINALGIKIAIDDFGTGYSSLSRLESFPFHKLKIDAQFTRNVDQDASKRRIVAAIIGLGQSLGIRVVAEGIETEEQSRIIKDLGCDYGQGWLFGRPVDAASLKVSGWRASERDDEDPIDCSPFQQFHQLQTLYEQAPVGLCFMDLGYRYVQLNELFASMHQKRPEDMIGKTLAQIVDGDMLAHVKSTLDVARASNAPINGVVELGNRVFRLLGNQVQDISGEIIGFSFVSVDITEQVKLLNALEERDQHYRHLIELGPNVGWAADPDGKVDYMSPLFDSRPDELMEDRIKRWYSRLHHEDAPILRQRWLEHLPSQKPFFARFRFRWEEGEYRHLVSRAVPSFGADGQVLRWYGVISDFGPSDDAATGGCGLPG